MTDEDLEALIAAGEEQRWPLLRTQAHMLDEVYALCHSPSISWHTSTLLSFEEDATPAARLDQDCRKCENVSLFSADNPEIWAWSRGAGLPAMQQWCVQNDGYVPTPQEVTVGQLIRYREGDFFTAHSDFAYYPLEGLHRVLVCLIGVSETDAYEGGELYFETINEKVKLGRGEIVVAPANLLHEVLPVTAGERMVIFVEYRAALAPLELQRFVDQFQHEPEPA